MNFKTIRIFICSAGIVLLIAAIAKFISGAGSAQILERNDPILYISFRHVFWMVGALELAVALICLFGRQFRLQAGLLAWLATNFILYRLGLLFVNYSKCQRTVKRDHLGSKCGPFWMIQDFPS